MNATALHANLEEHALTSGMPFLVIARQDLVAHLVTVIIYRSKCYI